MKYTIENFNGEFDPDIFLPIWKETLPNLDQRRIEWSYRGNKIDRPRVYLLKNEADQDYFGCIAVFPRIFKLGERSVSGGTVGDYAIKSNYQTLSPALALQKHMIANENPDEMLIGFPNKIAERIQLRCGFKPIGKMILYLKPFKIKSIIKNKAILLFAPLIDFCLRFKGFRWKGRKASFIVKTEATVDNRFNELWKEANKEFSLIAKRDSEYIQWRFLDNPYKKYDLFILEEGDSSKLKGFIVYKVSDCKVYIDDILWCGGDTVFEYLMDEFCSFCRKIGSYAIYIHIMENPKIDQLFTKNGFFKKKTNSTVLIRNMDLISGCMDKVLITKGDDDF